MASADVGRPVYLLSIVLPLQSYVPDLPELS